MNGPSYVRRRRADTAAITLVLVIAGATAGRAAEPRPPAVAGSFYPGDAAQLRDAVAALLAAATPPAPERPLALIAPHAGYVYSGQIAADAWRQAAGRDYDLVVIIGPNHQSPGFAGVRIDAGPGYRTPLGVAACDQATATRLRDADRRFASRTAGGDREHSVEVQVPFAQTVLPGVPIVAAVIGGDDPELWRDFGLALARVLHDRRALLVASSDLSHYPSREDAAASDRAVLAAAAKVDPDQLIAACGRELARDRPQLKTCACGEGPIVAVLVAARALGATRATVVSCANSGDTALGDPASCVGYGAVAVTAGERASDTAALSPATAAAAAAKLTDGDRATLLDLARRTLSQYLSTGTAPLARGLSPALNRRQGAFVTLERDGRLRGCIGRLSEDLPLGQAVGAMALQAGTRDPRFPPVSARELDGIRIEISVMTPLRPVSGPADIVVGRDGVVLSKDDRSAVFLPQVATEQGWDRDQLLVQLCRKAGLPDDAWRRGARFQTFQAEVFGEPERP